MQKIVLYIKNNDDVYKRVDMFNDETISLTSKIQDVRDIQKVFTDFTQTFTLPASKTNNKLFQHWYNYNIDNGFDARSRKDAIMELDFSPFRRGKISLNNVKMKDNKPFSYEVIFYGNTINLKDLLGDDELSTLGQLDDYTHDYTSTNVKTGLQTGLSSGKIIYPLISHTKRFYYDSAQSSPNYSGNLYYNTTQNNIGLAFDDLKPAVKCLTIIEAIEDKYTTANGYSSNVVFTRDFFNSTEFSNLFLWLSRNKGAVGGDENQEETLSRICSAWGYSSGDLGFNITGDTWTVSTSGHTRRYDAQLTITTAGANQSIPYSVKAVDYVTGNTLAQLALGSGASRDFTVQLISTFELVNYQIKWIVESNTNLSFTPTLNMTEYILNPITQTPTSTNTAVFNIGGTGASIATTSEIIITDNVPQIKTIDFLTGLFKMFNLTAYYIDDVADSDFGKIYVDTLDNYYLTGTYYDVSADIDVKTSEINAPTNYSGIDFVYEEPSTLVSINHEEQFNDVFGDAHVRRTNIDKTEIYKVEAPFEHIKYERIIDTNKTSTSPYSTIVSPTPYITDIQWGYSADGEFNGTFTPKVQGAATNTLSNKLKDTNQEFNNKVEVGDVVRNLTDNTSAKVTVVDSADTLSLSSDIMASGESYMILGDYTELGNYEPVLCKPLVFYGIRETMGSTKKINWISGGSAGLSFYYRPSNTNIEGTTSVPPTYTINFDNEVDEWNLTDYSDQTPPKSTNSLFKKFYEDYVEDLFDVKKRIFKVKAHLSMEVIINLKLNDTLIINNQAFKINSITTNLQTEMSELELLNVVDNYLPTANSLTDIGPLGNLNNVYYYSSSIGEASNLAIGDVLYTDTSLTNTLSAGTYYQDNTNDVPTHYCYVADPCSDTYIVINSSGQITNIQCEFCP